MAEPLIDTPLAEDTDLAGVAPDEAEAARGAAALRVARQTGRRTPEAFAEPASIASDEEYEALKPGTSFVAPDGTTRKKPWTVASDEDYAAVPEGETFMDPEGATRQKPKYEALDFTTQTLHNMAVNDRERYNALERAYPGKVKKTEGTGEFYVDDNGVLRKPRHAIEQNVGSVLTSQAAPVLGSVGGEILGGIGGAIGGPPGIFAGAVAGGAAGGAAGQGFNDLVLQLAGVYDRSGEEQLKETAIAGGLGGLGTAVGRGVAAAWPAAKGYIQNAFPRAAAKFLGADEPGLATAIALREKGVDLVPPSGWAKESPHLQNLVEVFDPAFRTQKPLLQSATKHYEETGTKQLAQMEQEGLIAAAPGGSLSEPAAAPSTREAGEALLARRVEASKVADERLQAAIDKQVFDSIYSPGAANPTALQSAAVEARNAAQKLVNEGFTDIQKDIDAAMLAAQSGHNSGDLWWNVGEKLKSTKQGIQARARKMYGDADALAGDALPNMKGLPQIADDFLRQLPEGFEKQHPAIVGKIRDLAGVPKVENGVPTGEWLKEPVNPTFGQLHELRSILRSNYNYLDLSPSIKDGTFKFFANKVDAILNDANAVPALREASKALRLADDFYRDSMRPLTDKNIQAVMNGLESGLPADPKNLYNTLVKEGRTDLTKKVAQMIGPNLWAGVKAADVQEMLDLSKTLVPGEIDGKVFVKQVLDRLRSGPGGGMLEAVHGAEASAKLIKQAQAIQMLDGKLPVTVRPGDTLSDVISEAVKTAEAAKAAASIDPLKALAQETKKIRSDHARELSKARRDDPLGFIYNPTVGATDAVEKILGNEDLILAAGARFGDKSPEFNLLRQVWAQRFLQGTLEPGARLAKVSPQVQAIMFPGVHLKEMQALAKEMDFLMSTRGAQDTAKSMAAQAKVEHPWSSVAFGLKVKFPLGGDAAGRALLGSYYKMVTTLSNNLTFMKWVMKGLKGDPAAREMTRQAVERAMAQGGRVGAAAGGALASGNNMLPGEDSEMPRYAQGGRPEPGAQALVGEGETPRPELWVSDSGKVRELGTHGPEVIVPDEPGTIIPNKTYKDYLMDAIRAVTRTTDPRQLTPPGPQTGSIPQDLAGSLPLASLALRPSAVRLTPTNTASPRLQVRGRFAGHTNDPMFAHPGVMNSPLVGGAMATNLIPEDSAPAVSRPAAPVISEDSSPTIERMLMAGGGGGGGKGEYAEAPPEMSSVSGKGGAGPAPIPGGGGGGKSQAVRAQTQNRRAQAQAPDPGLLAQIGALLRGSPDLARLVQPPRRGQAANGHYAEGGRPPAGQPAVVGDDPDRAEGIAKLKRKMGGDTPWYMQSTSPAWAEVNKRSDMADSAIVNAAVPRRYADGGRPPAGQPAVVGDQPQGDLSSLLGMFTGGGQLPGIAKAFMGQNPLEGVDTSNQASVLSSLFTGSGQMPGLASAFAGQNPFGGGAPGSPSLDSLTGMFGGSPGMAGAFHGGQPENPALQDDEENRRHRFGGSTPGYAEGGRPEVGEPAVVGEEMLAPEAPAMTYPTEAPTGDFSRPPLPESPFERAALTKRGGRPTPEPAPVSTPAEMAEALSVLAPAPLRAIAAAPKLATAALAGYYGLSGTSEAGGAESPDAVKKLQTELKEKGFYAGIIDGNMGPATLKAKEAFDKAEQVRMNNEKDQARILTDQKKAEADAAKAAAEGELAKAQLEETKRKGEEEKRKGEEREAGSKRLKEVESNLSTTQKLVRDYATPLGFTGGVIGGKALQSAVAKAYNKVMGNRAAAAEAVLAKEATGTPERVAAVNEFWRQGGGKVPFTNAPESTPGFAVNPKATSMDKLYKTPVATNVATDAAGAGLFGAESVAAQHWMVEPREEELKAANQAVAQDPSEVNIQRLQEAKDKLAVAEALKTMGRVGALSYLGGAAVKGRVHTKPSMDKAEAEKLDLEGVLRKSAETKAKSEKLKAAKAKKASAAAEVPEGRTLNIVPAGIPPAFTGSAAAQARRVNLR